MADTEPRPTDERLANVRPDPRPSPDHAGHDRWLVVRWTTDPTDLSQDETAQARAMLAACAECAALAEDIEVITRATAVSAVPSRPRDFRLTPERAASARGGIVDRVRRWLASPGSGAVRPLAGAAVAMGLVVVLVAPSLHPTGSSADGGVQPVTVLQATSMLKSTPAAPDGRNAAGAEAYAAASADTMSAESDMSQLRMAQSPAPSANGQTATRDAATQAPGPLAADAPTDVDGATTTPDADASTMDDTTFALTLLGIVLAGVGLMVLLMSWLARRWQDPLLR